MSDDLSLRIGIAGAGTAGCASALFLARLGHRVTLFDRVREPGPVGAGILLQPPGQAALAELGLLGAVLDHGHRIGRLRCRTTRGRTLFALDYADVDPSLFGLGLHRGVLFGTLFDAVRAEDGVSTSLGVELASMHRRGAERILVDRDGHEHGPFDLVLVCDGAGSQLRDDEDLTTRVATYPWGAVWFVTDDHDGVFQRELFQVVERAHTMVGFLPTGRAYRSEVPQVSLFYSLRGSALEAFRARPIESFREELVRYEPRVAPFVARIESTSTLLHASYRDVILRRFDARSVAYLGDAAHAMSPQLGQGANLALVDAWVLSHVLREGLRGASKARIDETLAPLLARYSALRLPHTRFYQFASRWLTPFFQGDSAFLGALRDATFPLASSLSILRDPMIRTMAGLRRGIVRRSFAIDDLARLPSST